MKNYRTVLFIGVTEVLIGGITLIGTLGSLVFSINQKSLNVLFFVVTAGIASFSLGVGLLRFKKTAYDLLLYFSSVIVLSKILIMLGVIRLNGALETVIPEDIKNIVSVVYHCYVIFYLRKPGIKEIFHN